jgi:hypothetical protein
MRNAFPAGAYCYDPAEAWHFQFEVGIVWYDNEISVPWSSEQRVISSM